MTTEAPLVLYAHPDRWTVGAEFPPEERDRMRKALVGFAGEWLAAGRGKVSVAAPRRAAVEDTPEQREALQRWKSRKPTVTPSVLGAALDAVLTSALWDSPEFEKGDTRLRFHRAWRIVLEPGSRAADEVNALAKKWRLVVRNK
jgi:hypothetical protein